MQDFIVQRQCLVLPVHAKGISHSYTNKTDAPLTTEMKKYIWDTMHINL